MMPMNMSSGTPTNATTYHIQHMPHGIPHLRKGRWSPAEDNRLLASIRIHGANKWKLVAQDVQTRSGDQCWKRWNDSLDPALNHQPWTLEEDQRLEASVEAMGRTWSKIAAEYLNGRSGLACKNRMDHLMRKRRRASHSNALAGSKASANSLSLHAFMNNRGFHGNCSAYNSSFDSSVEGIASRHYGIQTGSSSSPKNDGYSFGNGNGSGGNNSSGSNGGQYDMTSSSSSMNSHLSSQAGHIYAPSNSQQQRHRFGSSSSSAQGWPAASNTAMSSGSGNGGSGAATFYPGSSSSSAGVRQQLDNHASLYTSPYSSNHQFYGSSSSNNAGGYNSSSSNAMPTWHSNTLSGSTPARSHGSFASNGGESSQTYSSEVNSSLDANSGAVGGQSYSNSATATATATATTTSSSSSIYAPASSSSGTTVTTSSSGSYGLNQNYTSNSGVDSSAAAPGGACQQAPTFNNCKQNSTYFGRVYGQQNGVYTGNSSSSPLRQWTTSTANESHRTMTSTSASRPGTGTSLYDNASGRSSTSSSWMPQQQDEQGGNSNICKKENVPPINAVFSSPSSISTSQSSTGLWSSPLQPSRTNSLSSFSQGGSSSFLSTPSSAFANEYGSGGASGATPANRFLSAARSMGPASNYRFGGLSSLGGGTHQHEANGSVGLLAQPQQSQQQHAYSYDSAAMTSNVIKKEQLDDNPSFSNGRFRDVNLSLSSSSQAQSIVDEDSPVPRGMEDDDQEEEQNQHQQSDELASYHRHQDHQQEPQQELPNLHHRLSIGHSRHEQQYHEVADGEDNGDDLSETSRATTASFDFGLAARASSAHLPRDGPRSEKGSAGSETMSEPLEHATVAAMTAV